MYVELGVLNMLYGSLCVFFFGVGEGGGGA